MSKIALLSDFVVDQIAAGEVVEHPAAAVKELIENSIDAGALEIFIEIEGGGLQKILIEDDGCGMSREDALLCIKRHATSKIRSADDLQSLITMGFRGEALAALASISRLELKTSDGFESTQIIVDGGDVSKSSVCVRNRGTSIEARSLFYNAPARLKFQKSPAACSAAVLKVVQTISLAHPEIRFQLRSNGKLTFSVDKRSWRERAEEVLGPFAHEIKRELLGYSIQGLLGRPEEGKMNRSHQTLFVNRRPIFSPLIAKAVKVGFGTRMQESLFPVFVLFLDLPADLIDVNVHPQKKEIRFREEAKVFQWVRDAVAQAFGGEVEIAPVPWEFQPWIDPSPSDVTQTPVIEQKSFILEDAPLDFPMQASLRKVLLKDYLLIEEEDWTLIDIKGAESRILFEEMRKASPAIQSLLFPLEMQLEPQESAEEIVDLLKEAHIEARVSGKSSVSIDALPDGLDPANALAFIRQFINGCGDRRLAASVTRTCRASTRKCSLEQAIFIWHRLGNCLDKEYDPLGKKIAVRITEKQIAEFFH